jgi:hypothetical protein
MSSIIGIDSRIFERTTVKKDGTKGTFKSVIGIAVKVRDFQKIRATIQKCDRKSI